MSFVGDGAVILDKSRISLIYGGCDTLILFIFLFSEFFKTEEYVYVGNEESS